MGPVVTPEPWRKMSQIPLLIMGSSNPAPVTAWLNGLSKNLPFSCGVGVETKAQNLVLGMCSTLSHSPAFSCPSGAFLQEASQSPVRVCSTECLRRATVSTGVRPGLAYPPLFFLPHTDSC